MSQLTIYDDSSDVRQGGAPIWQSRDPIAIAQKLNAAGVRFEQWTASADLPAQADDTSVLAAYAGDIERLKREEGYQMVDVLRVLPDNPKRGELRQKFLSEHTHAEDEVRFFVEGAGMFYLRIGGQVYITLCERGDLIGVPDRVTHWFDLGATPHFTVLRFFTNEEGWVADYTGDPIAERFPKFEKVPA
jgi:1,2-dihydroxy-3-keto-5-methylthiopentene dioxygenase